MSASRMGRVVTEETKRKISESNKGKHNHTGYWLGRTRSEETKRKVSEALTGRKLPEGQKAGFEGRKHTEEAKKKMSKAHR